MILKAMEVRSDMFRFAHPYYFFLLIPVMIAAWRIYRHSIRRGVLYSAMASIPAEITWRMRAQNVLPLLFILSMILFVIALARPQTVLSNTMNKTDAVAIEMVVDVSGSMEALDMSTNDSGLKTRLDAVKEAFAEFVKKRPDDLIGLVTFAGYASTRAPLTTDHNALIHVLKGVRTPQQVTNEDGVITNQEELLTAIGDALATACARLREAEPVSKVIVLLSDGESNTGIISPDEALQALKKLGYRVYTIGVGSTGRAPFKDRDRWGRDVIVYGNVSLDEKLLTKIAESTGGEYFNVRNPGGLDSALEKIDELEKTSIEQNIYRQFNELFPWFLGPALGLLVLQTCMSMMIFRKIV